MEEVDVDKKMRKQTKIGWLIFWSDSFLNSFIKQKGDSVWVLTVNEDFRPIHIHPCDRKEQGDALGMEGAQVGVLIEANKVGLGRLLEGKHRGSLEAKF